MLSGSDRGGESPAFGISENKDMSKAALIERVAKKGKLSKAAASRTVDLVLGEMEAGLKASKKEGKYTVGTFGSFTIGKRKARKGRNQQPVPGACAPNCSLIKGSSALPGAPDYF